MRGTGLGLPLTRQLAQLLGGRVWLESQPGVGSTFFVSVARIYHPAEPVQSPEPMGTPSRWEPDPSRLPVLIVEDDPEMIHTYQELLHGTLFQLVPARSTSEARQILKTLRPRVIVLDVVLKGEDTWSLLAELKRQEATRDVPVLVITRIDDPQKARALGADAFARKPVDREWLLAQLTAHSVAAESRRLLVIDDDEVARYLFRNLLRDTAFLVSEAASGAEGVEMARLHKPDVIVCDMRLPGMSGLEVMGLAGGQRHDPRDPGHHDHGQEAVGRRAPLAREPRRHRLAEGVTGARGRRRRAEADDRARGEQRVNDSPVRVLVVDDYDPGRYARVTLLRRAGFEVLEAADGAEALEQAAAGRPHVVVLDVALPVVNGYEVCRRLKADPALPGLQVLHLSSAHRDSVDHARGLEAGADGYLVDPVAPEVLLATVRSLARAGSAEVAAGSAAHQWQLTVDTIPEGVCLVDRKGRILHYNAVLARLAGQGESLVGRDAREVLDVIMGGAGWDRGNDPLDAPRTVEREVGDKGWQLTTDIVRDAQGRPGGVVCVLRDVSERRRVDAMRAALLQMEQKARREAEAANHAKDEFLAVLSHELRTPLTAMLGWTAMLASGRLNTEAAAHAIEVVDRNTRLQARIIEDLLDVSRIISGKMTLRLEKVELGPALEAAVDSVRTVAAAKMVALEIRLGEGTGCLTGDGGRLQQVFANLLSNAVKFTPSGGRIVVTTTYQADSVVVAVSDTGRGIPDDLLPFIFEPFRQAEGAQRRTHTGLGLGLAIVRHVVELHGGSVHVASEGSGKGATFSVRLPVGTDEGTALPPDRASEGGDGDGVAARPAAAARRGRPGYA